MSWLIPWAERVLKTWFVTVFYPFWQLAQEMLDDRIPVENVIKTAAYHIHMAYSGLSSQTLNANEVLNEHGLKFALMYVALHDHYNVQNDKTWRVKPKLHLFLHLTREGSIPARVWTYRDEDFGGSVAKSARRRGGLLNGKATSHSVLWCFTSQCPAIRVL